MAPQVQVNLLGRKPGRGMRPWFLLPKVICVALYLGSLAAVLVLWVAGRFGALSADDPRREWLLEAVGLLIGRVVVPSLLAALVFGFALLFQHPIIFLRMRWVLVKLLTLAVLIPSAHLFCYSRFQVLRDAVQDGVTAPGAAHQLTAGLLATWVISAAVVLVSRHKPRLGQNWARSYPA